MRIRIYPVVIFMLFFAVTAYADTVVLKSGTEIDGDIVEQTNEFIRIDAYGTEMLFLADEIEEINGNDFSSPVVQDYEELMQEAGGLSTVAGDAEEIIPAALMEEAAEAVQEAVDTLKETSSAALEEAVSSGMVPEEVHEMIPPEAADILMDEEEAVGSPASTLAEKWGFGGDEKFMAAFMGIMVVLMVLGVILYVYAAICLMTIAQKTGAEPAWLAWIPIGNLFLMCNIAGVNYWWAGGMLLAGLVPWLGGLVCLGITVYLWYKIAEARNRPGWMGFLMMIPLANLVVMGLLAFSEERAAAPPAGEIPQAPPSAPASTPPSPESPGAGTSGAEQGPKDKEQQGPPQDIPPAPSF
ncbi:MAG: hypothetical protein MJA29_12385 [Candidatus Omnitrophica bacterium]|nr:hypothetical protein [Candidatus Omnitrophota bacterium]